MTADQGSNHDGDLSELLRALRTRVPVDAAELLAQEPPATIAAALDALPRGLAHRIAKELPDNLRPAAEADDTTPVPGQVSELMENARGVVKSGTTVQQAIEWLREAESVSDITYLFVVDDAENLLGLVVMRDLLLASLAQRVDDIMLRRPFAFSPVTPIKDAIKASVKRHYPVYPVVDSGKLVGVLRGWQLAERQAIEISAQSGQMVGISKEERITTGVWQAFKMRHPWLQLNLLTAFLAGAVVSMFSGTIEQIVALAAFLPILAGQSGNNGCQALAITLRGITLGDTDTMPMRKIMAKEAMLGAMNGLFTGVIAGVAMWWSAGGLHGDPHALRLALVILIAMTGSCTASGVFGVVIPLFLRRVGADPSTASAIFLTTGTDISGMGLMLLLATTLVL